MSKISALRRCSAPLREGEDSADEVPSKQATSLENQRFPSAGQSDAQGVRWFGVRAVLRFRRWSC